MNWNVLDAFGACCNVLGLPYLHFAVFAVELQSEYCAILQTKIAWFVRQGA